MFYNLHKIKNIFNHIHILDTFLRNQNYILLQFKTNIEFTKQMKRLYMLYFHTQKQNNYKINNLKYILPGNYHATL